MTVLIGNIVLDYYYYYYYYCYCYQYQKYSSIFYIKPQKIPGSHHNLGEYFTIWVVNFTQKFTAENSKWWQPRSFNF